MDTINLQINVAGGGHRDSMPRVFHPNLGLEAIVIAP
jgi:hypothetical protein